jgi:hypothetical protein
MSQWMQDLTAGWPMIRANLPTFFALAVLMFGAILGGVWWLMDWRYSSIISGRDAIIANKDSEIALFKGQRDDYKDKLSGATPDQAKARIDALEARFAAVEPRRLTAEQRAALMARLSPPAGAVPTVSIVAEATADSPQLAADFASVFRSAGGWTIVEPIAMGIGNRPPSGIAISVPDLNHPTVAVATVASALKAAKIEFDLRQAPLMEGIAVEMLICTKIIR